MSNQAAWIQSPKQNPLVVDDAPTTRAGPDEVVIKNAYLAINPVDWKIQHYGIGLPIYPNILGRDIAGEVVEVGSNVSRIKIGQRVIAHALGRVTGEPKHAGFQLYTVAFEITVSPIPDDMSYERAVVLPLSISTAAAGLYQKNYLALPYPSTAPVKSGKSILVWGGSSSVGSSAIQLAIATGLDVAATASSRNLEYVRALGVKWAFDYSKESVVNDIVETLQGSEFVGAFDAISSPETLKSTADIVSKLDGGKIATVLATPAGLPSNVSAIGVSAVTIATDEKEVGDAVWRKYVPDALASGQLLPRPEPLVIKGGLPKVQEGLNRLKQGISAAKVVIEI